MKVEKDLTYYMLRKDICHAIAEGDKAFLEAVYAEKLLPMTPYLLKLACSYGDVGIVSWLINKVQIPISDHVYAPEVHSIHACNAGSLECLLLLKVAMIPLASIEILLQQTTNHCSLMHEGHLEIVDYLLTTYSDHPALYKHQIADYNIKRFIGFLLPENVNLILWCHSKGYDVSLYDELVSSVENTPVFSPCSRPVSPIRELLEKRNAFNVMNV